MARPSKSPAVRDAEKRVERRRDEVIARARDLRSVRATKAADTRTAGRDLDLAVDDLDKAERELADARAASLEPTESATTAAEAE
ncbi:hypothetical protein [Sandaracinus amylolyticus]|uniref:hypothetical protein n=1 Tax=Sandaracinus amylolyticus TaxID=927083 RepID=UPI001F2F9566|nr:hypothetical protein [Sandaracinus amylolyticus]UJR81451.1 Hypothetical protein I5071_35100 [Sandaracinus amylolyticus]